MLFLNTIWLSLMLSNAASIRQSRIIGGSDAEIQDFPYHASIRRMSDFRHICGGAIISTRDILTAAHCVGEDVFNENNVVTVYTGSSDRWSTASGYLYEIQDVHIHPDFVGDETDLLAYQNDIAIVKIQSYIEFNQYQNQVNLPVHAVFHGNVGILTGWGSTDYPSEYLSDRLQKTWMTVIDNYICARYLPFNLHGGQFCAFQRLEVGPCYGDSGSPLVYQNTIIGVASFCRPCATGSPDIYTDVYYYMDFVRAVLSL